jgi:hypothetical protein
MSCQGGCNNNQYRRLCNYDGICDTCCDGGGGYQGHAWKCLGTGFGNNNESHCVITSDKPGTHGTYRNLRDCKQMCGGPIPPLGIDSFVCKSTGFGKAHNLCVHQSKPPGPGSFSNLQACQAKCK